MDISNIPKEYIVRICSKLLTSSNDDFFTIKNVIKIAKGNDNGNNIDLKRKKKPKTTV